MHELVTINTDRINARFNYEIFLTDPSEWGASQLFDLRAETSLVPETLGCVGVPGDGRSPDIQ